MKDYRKVILWGFAAVAALICWQGIAGLIFLFEPVADGPAVVTGSVLGDEEDFESSAFSPQMGSLGVGSMRSQDSKAHASMLGPIELSAREELLDLCQSLVAKYPKNFDLRRRVLKNLLAGNYSREFDGELEAVLSDFTEIELPAELATEIEAFRGESNVSKKAVKASRIVSLLEGMSYIEETNEPNPARDPEKSFAADAIVETVMVEPLLNADAMRDRGIGMLIDYQEWDEASAMVSAMGDSELRASYEVELLMRRGQMEDAKALLADYLSVNPNASHLSGFEQSLRSVNEADPRWMSVELQRIRGNLINKITP